MMPLFLRLLAHRGAFLVIKKFFLYLFLSYLLFFLARDKNAQKILNFFILCDTMDSKIKKRGF